jgi:hypothetical protein
MRLSTKSTCLSELIVCVDGRYHQVAPRKSARIQNVIGITDFNTMTPTYRRSDDHNARNVELRAETDRIGAPYFIKYQEAKQRMKTLDETEKCYLEYVEGYLTCTFNHTSGALCLGRTCQYCNELECVCYSDVERAQEIIKQAKTV